MDSKLQSIPADIKKLRDKRSTTREQRMILMIISKDFENDSAKEYYITQLSNLRRVITPSTFIEFNVVESYLDRGLDTIAEPLADPPAMARIRKRLGCRSANFILAKKAHGW
jgi:hypothetical protein